MNVFASIKKSFVVNKISRTISKPVKSVKDMMSNDYNKARERLFVLVEKNDVLRLVLQKHMAGRNELEDILRRLLVTGAGQWVKGHFVAVSALVFAHTLDYCLKRQKEDESDWRNISYELVMYFAEGKIGEVS